MKGKTLSKCSACWLIFLCIGMIMVLPMIISMNPQIPIYQLIGAFSIFVIPIIIVIFSYFKKQKNSSKIKAFLKISDDERIKELLNRKESEFLDFKFKSTGYDITSQDLKKKLKSKKEFIKDVLGLINNKTEENNWGMAFIIIGVSEEREKYNGKHDNIDYINQQPFIQLLNNHIRPKLTSIDFKEYYISGDDDINVSLKNKEGFDRNYLIKLKYEIGTVYEIKKKIGNKEIGYYNIGTSFTRDGSYTYPITHEDRIKIMNLKNKPIVRKRF